ncbi:head-tail joining protein [Sphingomonas sp. CV7422]|uniref:head-tail joining protein n=1 Tax=Sphingomonas sp. CV7422 TaxID=3018036 RepID=UPI0022FF0ED9|nr:hypothetical protein [Sphingomonas sp. CV7422]
MDPFAAALDALFYAPGSAAAVYIPEHGPIREIRVIRSQPDVEARFGDSQIIQATNLFEIRMSEVDRPAHGAQLFIGDEVYSIQGDGKLDLEGLTWTVGAEPNAR